MLLLESWQKPLLFTLTQTPKKCTSLFTHHSASGTPSPHSSPPLSFLKPQPLRFPCWTRRPFRVANK